MYTVSVELKELEFTSLKYIKLILILIFDNKSISSKIVLDDGETKNLSVIVIPLETGIFKGVLSFISETNDQTNTVSIEVEVKEKESIEVPLFPNSIYIFITGFIISSIAYSLKNRGDLKKKFEEIKSNIKFLEIELTFYKEFINNFDFHNFEKKHKIDNLVDAMKTSNIDHAEVIEENIKKFVEEITKRENLNLTSLEDPAKRKQQNVDQYLLEYYNNFKILQKYISIKNLQTIELHYWKYLLNYRWKNLLIPNIIALILGGIVALSSLFQQEYIKNLSYINLETGFLIFALGIGTDQIKQLLSRLSLKE